MTEQERLLNKENNILQNQNISYADGEEQAKKDLEQFKQNLIENFNEAELREEFVDECKDTDKQESIKLKNVDSLFAHKRFHFDYVCGDTGLIDEQAELKWFIENCCSITDLKKNWKTVCNKLNEVHKENEELKRKHYNELMEEGVKIEKLREENEELKQQLSDKTKNNVKLNISFMKFKVQLIEVLQQNYNYAYNQRQKNLDNSIVARNYELLYQTIDNIAETMNVYIERFPKR